MPDSKPCDFGLSPQIVRYLRNMPVLFEGLERVVIFGSRAKGTHKTGSDIDVALFGPTLDVHKVGEIDEYIKGLPTLYRWDVVHYDTLRHEGLKAHIDRVGRAV